MAVASLTKVSVFYGSPQEFVKHPGFAGFCDLGTNEGNASIEAMVTRHQCFRPFKGVLMLETACRNCCSGRLSQDCRGLVLGGLEAKLPLADGEGWRHP
jgi:hypothetical protein